MNRGTMSLDMSAPSCRCWKTRLAEVKLIGELQHNIAEYAEAIHNFHAAVCAMNGKKGIKYRVQLTRGKTATMTPEERKQMNEFVNTHSDELRRTAGPPMDLKKIFHRGPTE